MSKPCRVWQGAKSAGGYGQVRVGGKVAYVHRVAAEEAYGPIAEGLQVDHLCRNRACYEPTHLEIVTLRENVRRGRAGHHNKAKRERAHCKHGHEFTPENTYFNPRGERECRTCRSAQSRAAQERKKHVETV